MAMIMNKTPSKGTKAPKQLNTSTMGLANETNEQCAKAQI